MTTQIIVFFFFSSRRRHTRYWRDWSSDVCSSDLLEPRKSTGRPRKVNESAQILLKEDVKERPAATIGRRRRFLEHVTGTQLSDSTVRRLMKRLGFSQKNGLWGR